MRVGTMLSSCSQRSQKYRIDKMQQSIEAVQASAADQQDDVALSLIHI